MTGVLTCALPILGLSIARQIAEAQGGDLYAGHAAGNGAIFFLELPLAKLT